MLATTILFAITAASQTGVKYRVLATTQTSTMERELNDAAREGYLLSSAIGGETEFGGSELVAVVERDNSRELDYPFEYLVLATNSNGTMQAELEQASRLGFVFVAQTVFETDQAGHEVVIILERGPEGALLCDYQLLATQRTSTMQREIREHAERGFVVRGMSVAQTAFGGKEVVVVTERCTLP